MNILYNGTLLHEDELRLPISNRAFQYNDGFFETIIIVNGKIRFWRDHLDRMHSAATALKMNLPDIFFLPLFEEELLELARKSNALSYGRLKLKIWRGGGGIYTPETNKTEWLATVQSAAKLSDTINKVGICTSARTNYTPFSGFKGPNSLTYVMAGVEKSESGFDDLIMLNRQDIISELISSNIFWYLRGTLYTPALETGCVNGILRRNLIKWCQGEGIKVREVYFDVEGLLQADTVFAGNVTGIKTISNLIGFNLNQEQEIISFLNSKLAVS